MIITKESKDYIEEFETLLSNVTTELSRQAGSDPKHFLSSAGIKLEKDVFEILKEKAVSSPFKSLVIEYSKSNLEGINFPIEKLLKR